MAFVKYSRADLLPYCGVRPGETKLGERVLTLSDGDAQRSDSDSESCGELGWDDLLDARNNGARYFLFGIPEDIGPRANLGRAGSAEAWDACLSCLLSQQSNRFLLGDKLVIGGHIDCSSLMSEARDLSGEGDDLEKLRALCVKLDALVEPVAAMVAKAGLIPIVVGGGHNNSYPLIKGVALGLQAAQAGDGTLAVINCDPHADYRRLEGRHSGNGFSTAHQGGWLRDYCVLWLQEAANSESMLSGLDQQENVRYLSYESAYERCEISPIETMRRACVFLEKASRSVGLELDLDAIAGMPTSASSPVGITLREAVQYVQYMVERLPIVYFHLPEGAPSCGGADGRRVVGKALAHLISAFVRVNEARRHSFADGFGG